jgi:hypothetical protein
MMWMEKYVPASGRTLPVLAGPGFGFVHVQPRIQKDGTHSIEVWRESMFKVYVVHDGKRYTRVSNRRYAYAVLARYSTMIKQYESEDQAYHYLQDMLARGASPGDFGYTVSWAGSKELAEKKRRRLLKRFSDVIVRKARADGEVYALRYHSHNHGQDYEIVEPVKIKVKVKKKVKNIGPDR